MQSASIFRCSKVFGQFNEKPFDGHEWSIPLLSQQSEEWIGGVELEFGSCLNGAVQGDIISSEREHY